MICPYCHEQMELNYIDGKMPSVYILSDETGEYEEVEVSEWICPICEYTDTTYDA